LNTAKKLKQAWVEKTKIKSKWKHEKRKLQGEGIVAKLPWEIAKEYEEGQKMDQDQEGVEQNEEGEEEWGGTGLNSEANEMRTEKDESQNNPDLHKPTNKRPPESESSRPEKDLKSRQFSSSNRTNHDRRNIRSKRPTAGDDDDSVSKEPAQPSLRDLKREAYSRETLHTFKSDPLHKRPSQGRGGRGFPDRGRGSGRGRGGPPGRGQPDMKLRMNVMLEKIKRDMQ
jgi:hypothetical protein